MADEQKGTAYVVLRQATWADMPSAEGATEERPIPDTFGVLAKDGEPMTFVAPNDVAAIKAAEKETGQKFNHGAVAIPARSWRPRVPKDEMIPRRLWQ